MAFRLTANLGIGGQYQAVSPGDVAVLEEALPPRSRVLAGLVFAERYDRFLEECQRAESALREAGIPTWPEYNRLVTPDPDDEPVAWISYQSSPAFWTPILLIIGGIFLLPILGGSAMWIIDKLFPGATELISMVVMLVILGGVMKFIPKSEKR